MRGILMMVAVAMAATYAEGSYHPLSTRHHVCFQSPSHRRLFRRAPGRLKTFFGKISTVVSGRKGRADTEEASETTATMTTTSLPVGLPVVVSKAPEQAPLRPEDRIPIPGGRGYGEWMYDKVLGEGTSAIVLKAHNVNDPRQIAAIKFIHPDRIEHGKTLTGTDQYRTEIDTYAKLAGARNVLRMYSHNDHFVDEKRVAWKVEVLEFASAGSFDNIIPYEEGLEGPSARVWFSDIVHGIYELHNNNILHRDVKIDNMMLTKDEEIERYRGVVADLGYAFHYDGSPRALSTIQLSSCGTRQYIAPERAFPSVFGTITNPYKLDVFGLGVSLYVFLTGRFPPREYEFGPIRWDKALPHPNIDVVAEAALRGMMEASHQRRWTTEQLWRSEYIQKAEEIDTRPSVKSPVYLPTPVKPLPVASLLQSALSPQRKSLTEHGVVRAPVLPRTSWVAVMPTAPNVPSGPRGSKGMVDVGRKSGEIRSTRPSAEMKTGGMQDSRYRPQTPLNAATHVMVNG